MREKGMADYLDIPIGFKLYNSEGIDISNIVFSTKAQQEEELVAKYMSMDNVVGNSKGQSETKTDAQESKVDSVK